MSKHTPAPWKFMYRKQFEYWAVFMNHKMPDKYIATVFPDSVGDEEAEANARLIAAAPDLLESLQAIVDDFEFVKNNPGFGDRSAAYAKTARDAIAKAKNVVF